MNYEAAVRYLLTLGRELAAPTQVAAAKFDLENITVLAERLGRPERAYPSAHVAGTNGKGSTAAFLESIARSGVEFGVFEVGLGGRLDATNILSPIVSLITPVDFDHENFLGHSLQEIAAEKAGILKPAVPLVLAGQHLDAREVVLARARELRCPIIETGATYRVDQQSFESGCIRARITEIATDWSVEIAPSLRGRFQLENALSAVAAARVLSRQDFRITDESIVHGIAAPEWPGRLEKLHSRPDVYLH